MTIKLGIVADDFTGATDIASFIARAGWRVIQLNGTPATPVVLEAADALVISLKSRSCPAEQAMALTRQACEWLHAQGCERLYFKYCSTFDSTPAGNIGPVTDFMLGYTGVALAVLCPALPVNGRTVVQGNLYVNGELLNESGMQNHPLTPMTDAFLPRVMEQQSAGKCGLVSLEVLRSGKEAVQRHLGQMQSEGKSYAVMDAENDEDLSLLAAALPDDVLLTGGSGLAGALAALTPLPESSTADVMPSAQGESLVMAGSCSVMTNRQVAAYREIAPSQAIDIGRCLHDRSGYLAELIDWVRGQSAGKAPMLYATRPAAEVKAIQQRYGVEEAGNAIEQLFASLAVTLYDQGVNKFIIAGGETSSLIVQQLKVQGFSIGRSVAPGVPWVKDLHRPLWLTLKSGNFGEEQFFNQAQEFYHA
ncbi:3-oxo-tetronate kinase [Pantoea sp. BAV 3049]|uniref:3-oxo-tetronate kinase n=1 Tax=Pantoea sp. BAV 3049 TaxID=2654188 RepID=UPI00131E8444|nr:3-oxo-tetronate kinase [Pantoea sp. BAV 3049]